MGGTINRITCSTLAAFLLVPALATPAPARRKQVWDYSGGVYFKTDGAIPNGPCLRISGRITGGFFEHLKRVDDARGTEFLRGTERVTQFPEQILLQFAIRDFPCPQELKSGAAAASHLTAELMRPLRLSFYWKRGLELRPIKGIARKDFHLERIEPYAAQTDSGQPERLLWSYEFVVPSAGVPLTDHLVLVLREQDGRIVARVAARL